MQMLAFHVVPCIRDKTGVRTYAFALASRIAFLKSGTGIRNAVLIK
jgi:hypothetical protein